MLVTDVDAVAARASAKEIGGGARSLAVDVREHAQVDAAREEILKHADRLDVWVNNAGVLFTGQALTSIHRARVCNMLSTVAGRSASTPQDQAKDPDVIQTFVRFDSEVELRWGHAGATLGPQANERRRLTLTDAGRRLCRSAAVFGNYDRG